MGGGVTSSLHNCVTLSGESPRPDAARTLARRVAKSRGKLDSAGARARAFHTREARCHRERGGLRVSRNVTYYDDQSCSRSLRSLLEMLLRLKRTAISRAVFTRGLFQERILREPRPRARYEIVYVRYVKGR
jgi:hypothetical protein